MGQHLARILSHFGWSAALMVLLSVPTAHGATLEQMAGQMIVVGFEGDSVDDASIKKLISEIEAGTLGGVMYLKRNVSSLEAVRKMNQAFRAANPELPPFITIDQEGGSVERLTRDVGFTEIPSAADVAATMDDVAAARLYGDLAHRLAAEGFTVNFGPVADVNVNPKNPIIAKFGRAYSDQAIKVFQYDAAFVVGHDEAGVVSVLKHFPGHGSSTGDSHEGFVDISKSWEPSELAPYKMLLKQGSPVGMVMVGHLFVGDKGDGGQVPASLSPYWIGQVLRKEVGFSGVVITDDMEMAAVLKHYEFEDRIVRAVNAGVDVLLFSNTARPRTSIADDIRAVLVKHAEADREFYAKIEASYSKIIELKARIGR
jgi:beta-N-acetylhexosaminidase